jgi:NADH dehydrogenase
MKIFVTGGTGFVGRETISKLHTAGHQLRCLVRKGSEEKLPKIKELEPFFGDASEAVSLRGGLDGCDAVVHLIGIIREFPDQGKGVTFERLHVEATRNMVDLTVQSGIRRFLQMSANGAAEQGETGYQKSKWQAEELVRASGLDWTIFRPSIIFGAESEFIRMLVSIIKTLPVIPVIGNGRYEMQPVAVGQVADSFVRALDRPATIGRTYHLAGPKPYSYLEMLNTVSHALRRGEIKTIRQPLFLMRPAIKMLQTFQHFPITSDQLTMLLNGNVCDPSEWAKDFDLQPLDFADGIGDCLR